MDAVAAREDVFREVLAALEKRCHRFQSHLHSGYLGVRHELHPIRTSALSDSAVVFFCFSDLSAGVSLAFLCDEAAFRLLLFCFLPGRASCHGTGFHVPLQ